MAVSGMQEADSRAVVEAFLNALEFCKLRSLPGRDGREEMNHVGAT